MIQAIKRFIYRPSIQYIYTQLTSSNQECESKYLFILWFTCFFFMSIVGHFTVAVYLIEVYNLLFIPLIYLILNIVYLSYFMTHHFSLENPQLTKIINIPYGVLYNSFFFILHQQKILHQYHQLRTKEKLLLQNPSTAENEKWAHYYIYFSGKVMKDDFILMKKMGVTPLEFVKGMSDTTAEITLY